jgi:dienelactone hydrolase
MIAHDAVRMSSGEAAPRPPARRRSAVWWALGLVVALLSVGAGTFGLIRADDGLRRVETVVDGVPLETVTAAGAGRGPGVVVVHGFAGSTPLMRGFADTLARSGYTVVLLDVAGHGRSRLPFQPTAVVDNVLTALQYLRAQPSVDPARVGLLGHSMGAGAVLDAASRDPGVAATVAISTGSAAAVAPTARDVLVLAGGLEFAGIRAAGPQFVQAAYPGAQPDRTYGDPAAGTARRYAEIPDVEHVSVLFAPATHRAAVDWFDAALRPDRPVAAVIVPLDRVGAALLLHLAAVLSFAAVAALVLPRRAVPWRPAGPGAMAPAGGGRLAAVARGGRAGAHRAPNGRRRSLVVALLAPIVAAVGATAAMRVIPTAWLPIQVANYAIEWMAVFGLVLLVLGSLHLAQPRRRPSAGRVVIATVVLAAFTVAGFAIPAQLGWAWSTPAGPRLWLLLPAFVATAVLVAGIEVVGRRRILGHAWAALLVVLGIAGAALVGGAPSFVLFVAPLFAGLLVWQGFIAAVLRGRGAPVWAVAVVGGALLAWPLALSFPITG